MPFTLAHAAAAYPLRRTRLVLSALIIGTFAPDLEFFLRFAPKGPFGHTFRGFFLFSLPVAFAVFWAFQDVVKEPLAALMPRAVRQRITPGIYPFTPRQTGLVLLSILIGAASHILWDSFTHASYWPGHHVPFLRETATLPLVGVVHCYKLLQYLSSVFGCVLVFFWFRHWLRAAPIQKNPAGNLVPAAHVRIARILIPVSAVLGGLIHAFVSERHPSTPRQLEIWLGIWAVAAISFAWFELMFWGFTLPVRGADDLPPQPPAR